MWHRLEGSRAKLSLLSAEASCQTSQHLSPLQLHHTFSPLSDCLLQCLHFMSVSFCLVYDCFEEIEEF